VTLMGDGWEARMALRAARRRAEREAVEVVRAAEAANQRAAALAGVDEVRYNGWPLIGDRTAVLVGTTVFCAGCGACHGVTCVAFEAGWEPPGPMPDWPFGRDDCPVCAVG
jgi:hypothetical protein